MFGQAHPTASPNIGQEMSTVVPMILPSASVNDEHSPPSSLITLPGIPAVPARISQMILVDEYVEIVELCPDSWRMEELLFQYPGNPHPCSGTLRPRKKPVIHILTWMECFAVMAAIITCTSRYPEKTLQLFAYSRMIVRLCGIPVLVVITIII